MDVPAARITLVTLCVGDLARSIAFYEAMGLHRKARNAHGVAFFDAGGVVLSLWTADELAKDAGIAIDEAADFRGMTLAWNCASPEEVDAALARAAAAGAKTVRAPQGRLYGLFGRSRRTHLGGRVQSGLSAFGGWPVAAARLTVPPRCPHRDRLSIDLPPLPRILGA